MKRPPRMPLFCWNSIRIHCLQRKLSLPPVNRSETGMTLFGLLLSLLVSVRCSLTRHISETAVHSIVGAFNGKSGFLWAHKSIGSVPPCVYYIFVGTANQGSQSQ